MENELSRATCLLCNAHEELNYLLKHRELADVVDCVATLTLRKYQSNREQYGKAIKKLERAVEALACAHTRGE